MKKSIEKIIKPATIKPFYLWMVLSIMALLVVIGIAIFIYVGVLGVLPVIAFSLIYLLYYRFYLAKCEIRLNHYRKIITVVTPFSNRTFCINSVSFVVKKVGFRAPSYIVKILDAEGRKIVRLRDDSWDNIQNIFTLPYNPDSVTKEFRAKWR